MPTDDNSIDREGQQTDDDGGKYKVTSVESGQKLVEALLKRLNERDATIDEIRKQHTTTQQQVETLVNAQKKKLQEDGDFRTIAQQLEAQVATLSPAAELAKELDASLRNILEARIKTLPEVSQKAIAAMGLPPHKTLAWIEAHGDMLKLPPPPDFDAGKNGGKGAGSSVPELTATELEFARQAGITPERYLEMKKSKDKPIS